MEKLTKELEAHNIETFTIVHKNERVFTFGEGKLDELHQVNSISKSILGILIYLAREEGHIDSLNDPVHTYVKEAVGTPVEKVTINDLLTMTAGYTEAQWRETLQSAEYLQHILTLDRDESATFAYNNVCSYLLAVVLDRATGDAAEFFTSTLKDPLDLHATWEKTDEGVLLGGYGLRISANSLTKLVKELKSYTFFDELMKPRVDSGIRNQQYAHHWWVSKGTSRQPIIYYAAGRKGKFIFLIPEREIEVICTVTMENDLVPFQWLLKYLLPNKMFAKTE
ncbi:beta-lactamase family protein [Paenalkalicoccus suaedae]|uniref:Beta-lactamase family protein n=1 Tax=Paenalkalicoccus suaedae TaxID=2592382 RepID=A0A859FF55_9BACI|nr:serine hydrolase domain-containing protein [Paenalkalicoccus suaedae]QKS71214.1 beta-lactamase family protein [Paenalkalicoccus suaedae]